MLGNGNGVAVASPRSYKSVQYRNRLLEINIITQQKQRQVLLSSKSHYFANNQVEYNQPLRNAKQQLNTAPSTVPAIRINLRRKY